MASGDKVKKGFGFYLLMLILILIASFLIIVMILIFSPDKVILGYKYFSYDKSIVQTKTTDGEASTAIDFANIDDIVISSNYANVFVTKNTSTASDENVTKDSIVIENHAKGFAKSKSYTGFEYAVKLSEVVDEDTSQSRTVLTVSIKEPEGFLYFSKNVRINVCLGTASQTRFENTAFTITTKTGDVSIGNTSVKDEQASTTKINIQNLTVSTERGDINLAVGLGSSVNKEHSFNTLFLSTGGGAIKTDLDKISVAQDVKFSINGKGSATFKELVASKPLQLVINDGQFVATKITGSVKVLNLKNGSINIDNITNSFDTNKASDGLGKANITIKRVGGDLSIPYGNQANVNLGAVYGEYLINTTSGNVTIGTGVYPQDSKDEAVIEAKKQCGIYAPGSIETKSGKINVLIDDSTINSKYIHLANTVGLVHKFDSDNGEISIAFKQDIRTVNKIRTQGDVDVKINAGQKFLLELTDFDYKPVEKLENRINLAFIKDSYNIYTYPFKVNFVEGDNASLYEKNQIAINSNSRVDVHF